MEARTGRAINPTRLNTRPPNAPFPTTASAQRERESPPLEWRQKAEGSEEEEEGDDVVASIRRRAPDVRHRRPTSHCGCDRRPGWQRLGSERRFSSGFPSPCRSSDRILITLPVSRFSCSSYYDLILEIRRSILTVCPFSLFC